MIAMRDHCLDSDQLQQVLRGGLHGDAFESALEHLDECERCRESIDAMESGEPWIIDSLRGHDDPFQAETACQIALWRIMDTPDFSARPRPISPSAFPAQSLGPYDLIRPLGSGGMAAVYLAKHRRLQRQCAIKILPRERVDEPGWLERFDREMTTVASLEHSNVVRATDAGHEDGWHYLVMEYLEGMDVGHVAARLRRLAVTDACEIACQAAIGLDHIHQSGLVHRDVKPSNLMLTRNGTVKLLDLGLVLSGDDPLAVDDRLTTVGHLMGTLPYMAPEQLMDSRDVDERADIYALGATLYRLLAGHPPHARAKGVARQVMAITHEDAIPLSSIRDDVDATLSEYVQSLISRSPELRPTSASEVADSLARHAEPAGLKRLLRSAQRIPAADPTPSTMDHAIVQPSSVEPRSGMRRWLIATAFCFTLLFAGWTIKIATDKGDLVIQGVTDDITLEVRQGDELVDTLSVTATGDHRFRLRKGTYEVSVQGAEDIRLNQNIVTIGRGSETTIDVQGSTASRLYRGKDLGQWMALLNREEDPNALGEVMSAVEVLTRKTDARQRAARATMRTARIWGGLRSSSPNPNSVGMVDRNPSHHYMHHFSEIFPRYGKDAIPALREEFKSGNAQSRLASMWMLQTSGFFDLDLPVIWLEELRTAVKDLEAGDNPDRDQAINLGKRYAISWMMTRRVPLESQPWLHSYVLDQVKSAYTEWKQNANGVVSNMGGFGGQTPQRFLQESKLAAAVELHQLGKLQLDWSWVCANLVDDYYGRTSSRTDSLFEFVDRADRASLIEAIDGQLTVYQVPIVDANSHIFPGRSGSFWENRQWLPVYRLCNRESKWPQALRLYAEHADAAKAQSKLQSLRDLIKAQNIDPDHPDKPFAVIDEALEILAERTNEISSDASKSPGGDLPNL